MGEFNEVKLSFFVKSSRSIIFMVLLGGEFERLKSVFYVKSSRSIIFMVLQLVGEFKEVKSVF